MSPPTFDSTQSLVRYSIYAIAKISRKGHSLVTLGKLPDNTKRLSTKATYIFDQISILLVSDLSPSLSATFPLNRGEGCN